jgi:hypothetical protein
MAFLPILLISELVKVSRSSMERFEPILDFEQQPKAPFFWILFGRRTR